MLVVAFYSLVQTHDQFGLYLSWNGREIECLFRVLTKAFLNFINYH